MTTLHVTLPDESISDLREMAKHGGTTMTEALRRAVELQAFLAEKTAGGGSVLVQDKHRTIRRLVLVSR